MSGKLSLDISQSLPFTFIVYNNKIMSQEFGGEGSDKMYLLLIKGNSQMTQQLKKVAVQKEI